MKVTSSYNFRSYFLPKPLLPSSPLSDCLPSPPLHDRRGKSLCQGYRISRWIVVRKANQWVIFCAHNSGEEFKKYEKRLGPENWPLRTMGNKLLAPFESLSKLDRQFLHGDWKGISLKRYNFFLVLFWRVTLPPIWFDGPIFLIQGRLWKLLC